MINFKSYIITVKNRIDSKLLKYVHSEKCKINKQITKAMSYSLMAGGKRIRPALCIGTAKAIGGSKSIDIIIPLACAIEMIHTYSLIHDDLPSMDNDILRRGKLTCHKKFDEATAILAGDALLTLAFEILSDLELNKKIPPKLILKIIHNISVSAGSKGMIGGQMKDISSEGIILSKNQLKEMHILKTSMLIESAVICSATILCSTNDQLKQLKIYARNLGLAFQVTDDILNVIGNSKNLGKSVGTDSKRAKNTYPAIIGLDASKQFAKNLIEKALNALNFFDDRATFLRIIGKYILERNV